jgi:hypothetical protein
MTSDADPLRACMAAFTPAFITDPWVVRRLTARKPHWSSWPGRL